jgi:predicted membrane metal-binding protein
MLPLALALLLAGTVSAFPEGRRLELLAVALALVGWWWGSARLDSLDRSELRSRLETAARVRMTVTGPARRGKYDVRAPAVVTRFAGRGLRERVQLKLALGRAPPQGAVLDALVRVTAPRGPKNGFDERTWLRRQGVHVVLLVDRWRIVGRRGGLGGLADALRRQLQGSVARGLTGNRAAVVEGVVLGEDSGLSDEAKDRFRAAGLYHLLVS